MLHGTGQATQRLLHTSTCYVYVKSHKVYKYKHKRQKKLSEFPANPDYFANDTDTVYFIALEINGRIILVVTV